MHICKSRVLNFGKMGEKSEKCSQRGYFCQQFSSSLRDAKQKRRARLFCILLRNVTEKNLRKSYKSLYFYGAFYGMLRKMRPQFAGLIFCCTFAPSFEKERRKQLMYYREVECDSHVQRVATRIRDRAQNFRNNEKEHKQTNQRQEQPRSVRINLSGCKHDHRIRPPYPAGLEVPRHNHRGRHRQR